MDSEEPFIKINGRTLDKAMAMTVRVAIESFAGLLDDDLVEDNVGKSICEGYMNQINRIRKLIYLDKYE